MQSCESQAVN